MNTAHLQAVNLHCAIGTRPVLRDIGLQVLPSEIVGVVGPNGSGKSTLLRTLAGVLPASAGTVLLGGCALAAMRPRQRARAVAFLGQEETLLDGLTVHDAVALGRTPHRPPWAGGDLAERRAVAEALSAVDMLHAIDRRVEQLSGGERRRVLLARAVAQQAPLLVLDEPTNHLDARHQLDLAALLRSLQRTVVVAMHDLDLAASTCDRLVILHRGQVHAAGPAHTVLTPDTVREVFGVDATPVIHPHTGATHLLLTRAANRTTTVAKKGNSP